ncbi:MAG: hypothetical protein ACE5GK_05255 [Nitrospiria bacterium]
MDRSALFDTATDHVQDILTIALDHPPDRRTVIVFDEHSALSKLLSRAYRSVRPVAEAYDIDQSGPETVLAKLDTLSPGDLVVMVQSSRFRLSQFRIRIELFKRRLKVIEHPHLARIRESEYGTYVDALAYDPHYYRTLGPHLKARIAKAREIRIVCKDTELVYTGPFLDPRLNIGDYAGMHNIGGQFPIGELFTEPKAIDRVKGAVQIFAFGDADFSVHVPNRPFLVTIEQGILVSCPDAPSRFQAVLDEIREEERVVWVRELGFGLNRALTRDRRVSDIGAYERMCGVHLSLGAKHLQYKREGFPKKRGFHVDVFVDVQRVMVDGTPLYRDGGYMHGLAEEDDHGRERL